MALSNYNWVKIGFALRKLKILGDKVSFAMSPKKGRKVLGDGMSVSDGSERSIYCYTVGGRVFNFSFKCSLQYISIEGPWLLCLPAFLNIS